MAKAAPGPPTVRQVLRVPSKVDLTSLDPAARPIGPQDKKAAADEIPALGERLDALQEALFAEASGGGRRALLLVLQGMDTSGKGGVISHVAGLMNPQGLRIAAFKNPTPEEREHDFCGVSANRYPGRASWGSSTGRTTRTC